MNMFMETAMEKAFLVLNQVYTKDGSRKFVLNAFSNCREQGYSLISIETSRQVCFSENRNSDNIIVYWGNSREFDISTNHPEKWENKKYFRYDAYDEAAEWIVDFLRGKHNGEK